MKRYFTSDLHFFDEGIIWYCGRPYQSLEEMHDALRENFLETVEESEDIYLLGDICTGLSAREERAPLSSVSLQEVMRSFGIERKNFYLFRGNHDLLPESCYLDAGFKSAPRRAEMEVGGYRALLCHDPALAQSPDTLCICGHVHRLFGELYNPELNILVINVGVDVRGYRPISEDEIADIARKYNFKQDRVSAS